MHAKLYQKAQVNSNELNWHNSLAFIISLWPHTEKSIKGYIRCKIHFYMVFKHKCVMAVCVHNHLIMIKIHPVLFFKIPINNKLFLRSSCSQILCSVMYFWQAPDTALSDLSSVCHCFDAGAGVDKNVS